MIVQEEPTVQDRFHYVAEKWRLILAAACAAGLLGFAVSELMPRRYTAVTTVIIDPPGTNDPRTAMVVNPTYLDSLRTFERFFTSDTLFERAARRFHLDPGQAGVAVLRQRVLKVAVQRATRVIEVSATLPNPKDALALVQYITEQSINASREEAAATDRDTLRAVTEEFEQAASRFEKARAAWERTAAQGTPETLHSEVNSAIGLLSDIRKLETEATSAAVEFRSRAKEPDSRDPQEDAVIARAAEARAGEYAKLRLQLTGDITVKRKLLSEMTQKHSLASGELDAARKAYEAALGRKRDFSALNGLRSEHMRIIDPGVEPRQTSSPDVLFNVVAAMLLAACVSIAWLNLLAAARWQKPALVHTRTVRYEEPSRSSR